MESKSYANPNQPNLTEAAKFLNALAGKENEEFVFQTFDDNQSEGAEKRRELIRILTGTLNELAEELVRLNQAGAGIFVQVNVADGNGRKAENITALRAVFVDKDDGDLGELKLKPSILVQTKHGQHGFWKLVAGEPIDQFTPTQKALIYNLHTDKSVHNLDRVMRLPGFFHQKDPSDPFMVTVREVNEATYRIADVLATYPIAEKKKKDRPTKRERPTDNADAKLAKFRRWVSRQSTAEGGRNATIVKIVREGLGQGIEENSLYEIVEAYCDESDLPVAEGMAILERHIEQHENSEFEAYQNLAPMYEVMDGRIFWNKPTRDGINPVPLCNFNARIVKEEMHDDGAEKRLFFQIEGALSDGQPLPTISVTADEYPTLDWVTKHWGQRAIVYVAKGEHLRVAIQELSTIHTTRVSIYKHTGWRQVDGRYVYLNGNGTIGTNGTNGTDQTILVDLKSGRMADYALPTPPQDEQLKAAIRASLSILSVVPKSIAYPLLSAVYRSVLAECKSADFSIFVSGPTGCFKSSLIGVVQAHFGQSFNTNHLPDNWTSTENSLEKKAFLLKDCVFTIDEFTPNGTHAEADRLRAKAERILRSQGNQAGRGRMTSTCDMRPEYFPRGIIISTGEDMPPGQSLRARTVQIEMSHGDVDKLKLGKLQDAAANGLLSQSTAAYIQWLAPQINRLKKQIPHLHERLRHCVASTNMHNRTPDITASLAVGLWMFLRFALESGAIDRLTRRTLWREGWSSLIQVAEIQSGYQNTEDQTAKFVGYIKYALNMGEAYVANAQGRATDSDFAKEINGSTVKIGWLEDGQIWLDPDAAYSLVQQLARKQNDHMPISKQTLWKRLAQKRLIVPCSTEHRNTVKKTVEGRRQYVLVFPDASLFLENDKGQTSSLRPTSNGAYANGGVS